MLVEFALVAFALALLLTATAEFGRLFVMQQAANDAIRVAAREFALAPLPADITFEEALARPDVRATIYDADWLVVDLAQVDASGRTLEEFFAALPVVNRALRPLMHFDRIAGRRILRFPGALVTSTTSPSGFTVAVPKIVGRSDGVETIRWIPVLEEIRTDANDPATGPFSVTSLAPSTGLAALRLNVPYQAASLAGYRQTDLVGDSAGTLIEAGAVVSENAPPGLLAGSDNDDGPYAGPEGLGVLGSSARPVRPFRKLLAAQSIFRREVFTAVR